MEHDKELKEILDKWGVEETSDDFTLKTMQAIQGLHAQQHSSQPLASKSLRRTFYLFLMVGLVSLAVAALFMPPVSIPPDINAVLAQLNKETIYNLLSFIVSLWLLLFVNKWYEKRNDSRGEGDHYARYF